jgi:hypothetical protein
VQGNERFQKPADSDEPEEIRVVQIDVRSPESGFPQDVITRHEVPVDDAIHVKITEEGEVLRVWELTNRGEGRVESRLIDRG